MADDKLVVYQQDQMSVDDLARISKMFKVSGFFTDIKSEAQAGVKIMAGAEMGFGPFASVNGVHIIKGRPSLSAGLIASAIANSGRYRYTVTEHTKMICKIQFEELRSRWSIIGESEFTIQDAKDAGLMGNQTWKSYPRNMLYARAMSNGARWYCAGVFGGAVYVPEELGADVDGNGEIIDITPVERPPTPPAPAQPATDPALDALKQADLGEVEEPLALHWADTPSRWVPFIAWAEESLGLTEEECGDNIDGTTPENKAADIMRDYAHKKAKSWSQAPPK